MRVVWTSPTLERVEEIALYIARDDAGAAERWTNEIFDGVERLTEFPESGRVVPELGSREVRELIIGAYRVFYRVGSAVEVLSVRHGSQLIRRDELAGDQPSRCIDPSR